MTTAYLAVVIWRHSPRASYTEDVDCIILGLWSIKWHLTIQIDSLINYGHNSDKYTKQWLIFSRGTYFPDYDYENQFCQSALVFLQFKV